MVDTSVWIDYFRGRPLPHVQALHEIVSNTDAVLLGDLVLTEVLQGLKFKREIEQTESQFDPLIVRTMGGEKVARRSAEFVRVLRGQGITIRNTIDCLIATWCIENRVPLLYNDRDFEHFLQFGLVKA